MQRILIDKWNRREYYRFYTAEPGGVPVGTITVRMDATALYSWTKKHDYPFFLTYCYLALRVMDDIENFRYRQAEDTHTEVLLFDHLAAGITVARPDHSFGFAYLEYHEKLSDFCADAQKKIDACKAANGLQRANRKDISFFTVVPNLDFTALSFNRTGPMDIPRIAFGKSVLKDGTRSFSMAIQYNHAFIDGYHLGVFVEKLQDSFNNPDSVIN